MSPRPVFFTSAPRIRGLAMMPPAASTAQTAMLAGQTPTPAASESPGPRNQPTVPTLSAAEIAGRRPRARRTLGRGRVLGDIRLTNYPEGVSFSSLRARARAEPHAGHPLSLRTPIHRVGPLE